MKNSKITALNMEQYCDIAMGVPDEYEIERVDHAGMVADKFVKHPELGDVILIASHQDGGIIIHA